MANPLLPVDEELKLLDELNQFLPANNGLNGYWTAYAILTAPKKDDLHPLEDWLVNRSPGFIATHQVAKVNWIVSVRQKQIHQAAVITIAPDCLGRYLNHQ